LLKLDPVNPQTTARLCSAFETWKRYGPQAQEDLQVQMKRIADTPTLSRDTSEMINRIRSS